MNLIAIATFPFLFFRELFQISDIAPFPSISRKSNIIIFETIGNEIADPYSTVTHKDYPIRFSPQTVKGWWIKDRLQGREPLIDSHRQ